MTDHPDKSARQHPGGARPDLSVVVPVCNEAENINPLHQRLTDTLREYGKSFEVVFIDDGSTDQSFERLKELYDRDTSVKVIQFARNFGQQMAVSAGLQYARGNVVVLIDADLQNSPEEIPILVDKLTEGYDIVYGVRKRRVGSVVRRLGSWFTSHLIWRVTGIDLPDSASGFTALDRRFVEKINLFNEKSRYLSGLFAWLSYGRAAAVPVSHFPRHAGETKYTITQLVTLTLNLVCNFSVLPLRLALYGGWLITMLAGLELVCLAVSRAAGLTAGRDTAIWALVGVVALFSGVILLAIGILGEYIGRIYREVREQPAFVVHEVLDHSHSREQGHS